MKPRSGSKYKVIGVMSGTSLDGLDLAAVEFYYNDGKWNFQITAAETVAYGHDWENRLRGSTELSGEKLILLHADYGRFLGKEIKWFMNATGFIPEIIASHGHTVFHQPEKYFTFQVGNGADIAAETGITTVADFRTGDVALGGQGAPLVPVGDRLLFSEYETCLNLGGFANISFEQNGKRIAFDICPANFILNDLVRKLGKPYDENGELGRQGTIDNQLLEKLNQLEFYAQNPPKSLGKEWMDSYFSPVTEESNLSVQDKLRTAYEHIAIQIAKATPATGKVLVTGGGAFNTFLIEQLKTHSSAEIIIPEKQIIDYKEALVFAFLGLLRHLGEVNCYASVTGASRDSSSGVIFPDGVD
ncbi:anhydro-N-acetylmuramic acid kinase [Tangfeifania diversioriginum]|uniref:Anhydro-N-acetylmuramic acid kinase n=1 Tax=Tangfeifania diversioriginum TaxID=1168035 RepID=A0A1M6LLB3_9BACT|nr:anhydro-N-acetylmuramic acid kinase [Tangfeifania diversioriginum]SHJ71968.1 anhydro-N-acetylmuramic acid kinase [Tangfeifania diversioriginum]